MSEGKDDINPEECDCMVHQLMRAGFINENHGWNHEKVLEHLRSSEQILFLFGNSALEMSVSQGNMHLIQRAMLPEYDEADGAAWVHTLMSRHVDLTRAARTVSELMGWLAQRDSDDAEKEVGEALTESEKEMLMALLKDVDVH
jgi:hypothetical protein